MAEFDRVRRRRSLWRWGTAAMGVAACLAAALLVPKASVPQPAVTASAAVVAKMEAVPASVLVVKKPRRRRIPAKSDADPSEFVRIPFTMPLGPSDRASVMRVELPVSALVAAGMPMLTADTAARAEADVLVGADGLARAIRVISISNYKEMYR